MEEMPSLWLVHFTVRSAEGIAALWIEHPVSRQTLMLPVYPSDAVTEALPLLEPAFAHYAAQWPRIMVANPEEPEDKDFFVEASELPARITDPSNRERLQEILERHL